MSVTIILRIKIKEITFARKYWVKLIYNRLYKKMPSPNESQN
jgi:hypothetical protein